MLRVLVACEFSGIVRNAFVRAGHDAMSCDLLPSETERPDGWDGHYQGSVEELFEEMARGRYAFDLMIAHPPCTYLANSGIRWLYNNGRKADGANGPRWMAMAEAARFYRLLRDAPIPRRAIENPRMIPYARDLIGSPGRLQVIHPWQFGHPETKATCLELIGLPDLTPTNIVTGRAPRVHHEPPGPDRWKNRSRTLSGIAEAMATQWGGLAV